MMGCWGEGCGLRRRQDRSLGVPDHKGSFRLTLRSFDLSYIIFKHVCALI